MKKWLANIGYIIFIFAIFVSVPMLINSLVFLYEKYFTSGTNKEWLSFFSSYAGGFVGAVATLIVVTIQLKHQRRMELEKENRERTFKQLPALIYLENEIEKMIISLEVAHRKKNHFDEIEKEKKIEEKGRELDEIDCLDIADNVKFKQYDVKLVSDKCYEYIATIENVLLHVWLLECFNFYKDFSQAITYDLESLTMDYKKIARELANDKNDETTLKFAQMREQRKKIMIEKKKAWMNFEDENMLERFKSTLKDVKKELDHSMKLKNKQ
ncbi:hypothetical protein IEQ_01008 [Bacillus cereus BAG6X1-2]|nr:hypothetical protein IEQ_01008 [Bacillus cereus BAG6X1-2]